MITFRTVKLFSSGGGGEDFALLDDGSRLTGPVASFPAFVALANHIDAMADDAYLVGHPEFVEIAREAREALKATA